jgi:hypothetical protein
LGWGKHGEEGFGEKQRVSPYKKAFSVLMPRLLAAESFIDDKKIGSLLKQRKI